MERFLFKFYETFRRYDKIHRVQKLKINATNIQINMDIISKYFHADNSAEYATEKETPSNNGRKVTSLISLNQLKWKDIALY